jgi:undecaprenyl-diphosphatase
LDHYLQIIILGIVEGVTEFLPISSTGHLLIAEHLLGTTEPEVFNVVIQAGAILAVVFIYWGKILSLLGSLDKPDSRGYIMKILAAFVVTGIVGVVLKKGLHLNLPESLTPVAWATLIGGLVILLVEFFSKNLYPHEDVSWPEAIAMGLAQVVAGLLPGTSRSGATIMTGLAMGMKRPAATEFSFLVGIPTMFAASALDLWTARKDLTHGGHQLIIDIAIGFVVSAVVAFFVIKWLLHFVVSHTFNGFAVYRIVLGLVLLGALANGSLPEISAKKKAVAETPPPSAPAASESSPTPTLTPTPTQMEAPPTMAPALAPTNDVVSPATNEAPVTILTPTPANTDLPASTNAPPRALPVSPTDLNNEAAAPATNSVTPVPTPATPVQ